MFDLPGRDDDQSDDTNQYDTIQWPEVRHASPCDDHDAAREACDNPWCVDCDSPAAVSVDDGAYLHPYCEDCGADAVGEGGREYGLSALATYEGRWPTSTPTMKRIRRDGCVEYLMAASPTGATDEAPPAEDAEWIRAINSRHVRSAEYAPDEA